MANPMKKTKGEYISPLQDFDYLSIFDEQFTISNFDEAIKSEKEESQSVIAKGRTAVQNAFQQVDDESYHYEVVMDDEMKAGIEAGKVELVTGKDGLTYAMVRGEKGRFSERLPIEKQLDEQGITGEQLQLAIQMDAIQKQLETMISALKSIEGRVSKVIEGQQNDRIGLFFSGLSLYEEAKNTSDYNFKTQLQCQALKALSDANSQVIQEIRSNIEYLASEQYKGSKQSEVLIEEHLAMIHKCYDVVYRSTFLKAAIYHERGEVAAMLTAINEYGRFIEKLIIPSTALLSELDRNEKFIDKGTWGQIANTVNLCGEMRKQLNSNEPILLTMEGE